MDGVLKQIMRIATGSTLKSFDEHCRALGDTQSRVLRRLIGLNKSSAFGRDHGFASIKTMSDFQRAVPVCTYEDLQPYIERALNGEPHQLTAEKPVMFATTSGTTGASKYIPVTPTSRASKSKLMRVWLGSLFKDHPGTLDGKIIAVVSPEAESYSPGGIPCGAESGHGYRAMSPAVRTQYSAPYEVAEIKDYEARYYALVRIACGQSVSLIFACNPSTVLLLAQKMGARTEEIIKDVRDGTLSSNFDIAPEIRQVIEPLLAPDPQRATELEAAAYRGGGRLLPRTVWPELACVACWKGGTVGMYLDRFGDYVDPATPVRDIGYFASEVRGSVVLSDEGSSGVLSVTENLFEFAPANGAAKPSGDELLLPHQLEQGGQYFIYVTTLAGLYRYEMNDLMEVTGFYGQTPVLRFLHKGKGMVSFTGEKLSESQVITAVERGLADRRGAFEFIAAIGEVPDETPRYAFLVEFNEPLGDDDGHRMLRGIEDALCELNVEYGAKRKSLRIDAPVLRTIRPGAFNDYRRREVEKGRMDGQFKTLRLTTNTAFANEFEVEGEVALQD
jgi:hypothetical protein